MKPWLTRRRDLAGASFLITCRKPPMAVSGPFLGYPLSDLNGTVTVTPRLGSAFPPHPSY